MLTLLWTDSTANAGISHFPLIRSAENLLAFGEHVSDFGRSRRRRCISLARSGQLVRLHCSESASIFCDNVEQLFPGSTVASAMPLFEDGKGENSFMLTLTLTFAETNRTCLGRAENASGNTAKSLHVSFSRAARLCPSEKKSYCECSNLHNFFCLTTSQAKYPVGERERRIISTKAQRELHFECLERETLLLLLPHPVRSLWGECAAHARVSYFPAP